MPEVPVLDADAVFAAVPPTEAVTRTREAFLRHARGEWAMPAKVYLDSPPSGDFRAMPARGGGFALLKWVTSFPHNPGRGLPVVTGAVLLSDAETGELRAIMDCAAVTSLRTGAAAAVASTALAAQGARSVGVIGCGVNGAWAARCLRESGFGPGICADGRPEVAAALADELGWSTGSRGEAASQPVVVTVTPGEEPVVRADDLQPGQHLSVLGADAHGKAETELAVLDRCELFCDEWKQSAAGGELAHGADAGLVTRADVRQLGDVLDGRVEGRRSADEITLFDSTGLAIQDLGIAISVFEAWRKGGIAASMANL